MSKDEVNAYIQSASIDFIEPPDDPRLKSVTMVSLCSKIYTAHSIVLILILKY